METDERHFTISLKSTRNGFITISILLLLLAFFRVFQAGTLGIPFTIFMFSQIVFFASEIYYRRTM
jgi:hypothetical protein